ncbi:hypothetical protein Plhal304r1_c013g0048871 [Plasmopara halstedii]
MMLQHSQYLAQQSVHHASPIGHCFLNRGSSVFTAYLLCRGQQLMLVSSA